MNDLILRNSIYDYYSRGHYENKKLLDLKENVAPQ